MSESPEEEKAGFEAPSIVVDETDYDANDEEVLSETLDRLREDLRRSRSAHSLALEREQAASEHARLTAARLERAQHRYAAGLERDLDEALRSKQAGERTLPPLDEHLDIRPIVEGLMSSSSAKRLDAKQRYNDLGFDAVGPLLKLIQREGIRRDRRIAIAAAAAVFSIVLVFGQLFFTPQAIFSNGPVYALLLALLIVLLFYTGPSSIQKKSAQLLSEFDDPRLIAPLADCLGTTDAYTSRVAAAGLKRMLRRVRATDSALIPPESMAALYRALHGRDPDLVIAVLASLEQIGDEKAFPYVEKLAEMNPFSSAERRVKKAAQDCLPALLLRARKGAVSQTLLRASTAPDTDSLLRPVAQSSESDPMELLRPADSGG